MSQSRTRRRRTAPERRRPQGSTSPPPQADSRGAVVAGLEETCRRQTGMLDGLARALKALRAGAAALRAENASLRADNARLRLRPGAERAEGMESRVVRLPLDARAPAAARAAVAECLSGHVEPAVLDAAQLLASELVTNSLRHSGAADGEAVVLDVELRPRGVRIEVEDPGRDGAIVPRRPDLDHGGGIGLLLVQAMSERWGFERVTAGGTRVWAQIASTPVLGRSTR